MQRNNDAGSRFAFGLLIVLALGIGAYAWIAYGSPSGAKHQPFSTEKGDLPSLWYGVLWTHAVSAGTALAFGWLQFVRRIRARSVRAHRTIGLAYSVLIAIGSVTGFYLAGYANGGWVAQIGFAALSLLWLYTLSRGWKSIVYDRDPAAHGRWMTRNYALTCAAIALRIYTPLADALFGLTDTNDTFPVISWLCWLPNLLIAEIVLARRHMKNPAALREGAGGDRINDSV